MTGTFTFQHAKVARFEVSIGKHDADRTLEEFLDDIRARLDGLGTLTLHGGYYIIDGTVCTPDDYDPTTRNRKPGTHPPAWAGGPQPTSSPQQPVDHNDEPREFVRVTPTLTRERTKTGRRRRSDAGKARGPKSTKTV